MQNFFQEKYHCLKPSKLQPLPIVQQSKESLLFMDIKVYPSTTYVSKVHLGEVGFFPMNIKSTVRSFLLESYKQVRVSTYIQDI